MKEEKLPFNKPVYDKFLKIRREETVIVHPSPVLIVEGALILCSDILRQSLDLAVFIDCDDDVRLSRRVLKNERKEGANKQSLSELLKTYEDKTKPAFEKFIEPSKKYANTIIPNYGFSTEQLELDKMSVPAVDLIISFIET